MGKKRSDETKYKMHLKRQDPDWRRNTLVKSLCQRPTRLEQDFIRVIELYDLPLRYVGNGSFLVGLKNPDFINTLGRPLCLETANWFHHQGNWAQERIKYFADNGWECVVVRPIDKRDSRVAISQELVDYLRM